MEHAAIFPARFPAHLAVVRELFAAYEQSQESKICFADFQRELDTLPGAYAEPLGCILLAAAGGRPAGCVALRRESDEQAEMKRLYVRPAARRAGLGRFLATRALDEALKRGYTSVRLETLPGMVEARALYESLGFTAIERSAASPVHVMVWTKPAGAGAFTA